MSPCRANLTSYHLSLRRSDVLDTTVNYGAHVKFVNKWLDRLDEEERQANAPPPREPGLITEPGLATDEQEHDSSHQNHIHEAPVTQVDDSAHRESVSAAPAIQG